LIDQAYIHSNAAPDSSNQNPLTLYSLTSFSTETLSLTEAPDRGLPSPARVQSVRATSSISDLDPSSRATHDVSSAPSSLPAPVDSPSVLVAVPTVYVCNRCDKSFEARWQLNRHLKAHEKPFVCSHPACNVGFRYRKDKLRHEKAIHPELFASALSVYACSAIGVVGCSFSSSRRDNWHKHIKAKHPGVAPG
jgi:hypothetical protein